MYSIWIKSENKSHMNDDDHKLKKLIKENDKIRKNPNSRSTIFDNLGKIVDI